MKRRLAVCDCETDPFRILRVPVPFLWGYYDGREYREFDSDAAFVAFLREQYVICYAHNGGKFDWHFLLPYINPYDEILLINSRIAKVNIGYAECRDSYNILPVPLAAYKKDTIDYSIMEAGERNKPHNRRKISAYLQSDCVYLHELITKFADNYGVQITQASAAMKQWAKISQRPTPNTDKEFYDTFAPYYYGGRVQCFQSGIIDKDFSVYDINSAYPYAMLHEHPYSEEFTHVDGYTPDADFVRVRAVSGGAFPYRGLGSPHSVAGLWFPSDKVEREYTVTKWEYDTARETGTINKQHTVVSSVVFSDHVHFGDYINHFYALRLQAKAEGNEAVSLFGKLFMNSLYGKFASNPENYRNYMVVPMDVIAGLEQEGWTFAGEMGPWALAEQVLSTEQQRYYNIATGASITGFVRAMLWRHICDSGGVLYCDTDGIAVERKGSSMILSDDLGKWKHEGDFDRAGIAGKKLYIFRDAEHKARYSCMLHPGEKCMYKHASKGARLTHQQLWMVARGVTVEYVPDVPTFSPTRAPVFTKRKLRFTA